MGQTVLKAFVLECDAFGKCTYCVHDARHYYGGELLNNLHGGFSGFKSDRDASKLLLGSIDRGNKVD